MAFEPIVRNFETPAPLSTDRIIQEVTKIPAQRARLRLAPGAVVEPVCRLTLRPGQTLPMLVEHRD